MRLRRSGVIVIFAVLLPLLWLSAFAQQPLRRSDIILWKYPDAKFAMQGDQLEPHVAPNGDRAYGLLWIDDRYPRPTLAEVESWRAAAEAAAAAERAKPTLEQRLQQVEQRLDKICKKYPAECQ